MAWFFAVTLFVSAFLLFLVQPMVGKMVLPLLGGAPAAWATCMVFFQALLLAGYAYAHASIRRFGARRQSVLHLLVLTLPLIVLGLTAWSTGTPIRAVRALAPQSDAQPFWAAIALLSAAIAVPFFVVATSAPLLQRWFSETNHPAARDPYFLYAASNLGSLLALVAYPFFVEPRFRLSEQGWLWSAGYLIMVGLTIGCAWTLARSPRPLANLAPATVEPPTHWPDRLRWMALAFVPSSLMLSVTQFITTDIAPIPGLWVLPLGVYLLTFIVAFGRTPKLFQKSVEILTPIAVLLLIYTLLTEQKPDTWGALLARHLGVFLLIALNLHMELARRRPGPGRLTEFYLWVSLGGVLGGLFNSLVAPLIFNQLFEYPLALIAACFLQSRSSDSINDSPIAKVLDFAAPLAVAGLVFVLLKMPDHWMPLVAKFPIPYLGPFDVSGKTLQKYLVFGLPSVASYLCVDRPLRFGLCVAAVWLVPTIQSEIDARTDHRLLKQDRSFFGVLAVQEDVDRTVKGDTIKGGHDEPPVFHRLVHGTTLHGLQQFQPFSGEPLTYYHRTGPIGQLFMASPPAVQQGRFAFVGLGGGSLAAYGQPGQQITFYEIDPAIRRIAENPKFFTYLRDCRAKCNIVMGDARLKLEDYDGPKYSLIVVDAFTSDAIPIHLLTKEALQLYLDKLADDGIIALHVSNRYLKLDHVVSRLAKELNLVGLEQFDLDTYQQKFEPGEDMDAAEFKIPGKRGSQWMVLARKEKDFGGLRELPLQMNFQGKMVELSQWIPLPDVPNAPLWTDDFSNLYQILNWEYIVPWTVEQHDTNRN